MNKKEYIYIIIFSIGALTLTSFLLHDHIQGEIIKFGFIDKVGILVGSIFTVIGLILFIFDRYKIFGKEGILYTKKNFLEGLLVIILVTSLAGGAGFIYYHYNYTLTTPKGQWSIGIYISSSHEPFNFTGENVNNPVLTANDVTDSPAIHIADPFLIHENDTFYMFFEVVNFYTDRGDIGLAISNNGLNWSYSQIVLKEPFHLSYPCVFKFKNEYYMIPETARTNSIRLYKAIDFPYCWLYLKTLLKGRNFTDNTIFYYNNTWWLFTLTGHNYSLRLYYSDNLLGPWTEHPKSPILKDDANFARPGGNVIVYDNRIVRYTQDNDPYYGNQVWAFEITIITKKNYEENRIGNRPILKGFDYWNTRGMHHISPLQVNDNRWIASVDGY